MRYLLIILSFLFWSCSIYSIVARMGSGTMMGYSNEDCVKIEWTCADKNGEYNYNTNPEGNWMCSCTWDSNDEQQ